MNKLKKILSSFTCLLILAAFTGAISLEFGSVTLSKPRAEISRTNQHADINLSLISEEKDDANDHQQLAALPIELFLILFVFFISTLFLFNTLFSFKNSVSENYLFIKFRSLRL